MPGILLNWKRFADDNRKRIGPNRAFWWDELGAEAAQTRNGNSVLRGWAISNRKNIELGSPFFLIAQGGISDGIMASGLAVSPPSGKTPVEADSVVYVDSNWRTGKPSHYVMVQFDAILDVRAYSGQVLPTKSLKGGGLHMMLWNTQRAGIEIKPMARFRSDANLLPQLKLLWRQHLERIGFPLVSDDEAETAAIQIFGYEGRIKVRIHKARERSPLLAKTKKAEALREHGELVCEVCKFVFTARYSDHGSGFIECHHRQPLSMIGDTGGSKVTLDDLALVCANCHRMLHWKDWPSVEELRARLT
jgi:hypothetical protein